MERKVLTKKYFVMTSHSCLPWRMLDWKLSGKRPTSSSTSGRLSAASTLGGLLAGPSRRSLLSMALLSLLWVLIISYPLSKLLLKCRNNKYFSFYF